MAVEAVFRSWNGKRARDYRNATDIPHDLGTAVNIQAMVFGNVGDDSATGVAMSRDATTGANVLEGDFLVNAQGEDVVAGIRETRPIAELAELMPEPAAEFAAIARRLEQHFHEMQDMEFTIERGKLWLLQTRTGKRTAQAAVRIAVEQAEEGLISREDAVRRVQPEQIDTFLHPQVSAAAKAEVARAGDGAQRLPGCGGRPGRLRRRPGGAVGPGRGSRRHPRPPRDQARRRARAARGQGRPDLQRWPHQPRRPRRPPVRAARGGRCVRRPRRPRDPTVWSSATSRWPRASG